MHYNVVVTEEYMTGVDEEFSNYLIFTFRSKKEALAFAEQMLDVSPYSIKIIKVEEETDE